MASPNDSGRSPSGALKSRSVSPSPHPQYHPHDAVHGLGLDISVNTDPFSTAAFGNNLNAGPSGSQSYAYPTTGYFSAAPVSQNLSPSDQTFNHGIPYSQSFETSFVNQLEQSSGLRALPPEDSFSNLLNSNPTDFDFSVYPNSDPAVTTNSSNDNSSNSNKQLGSLHFPDSLAHQQSQAVNQAVNPVDLISRISSPPTSTPPQLSPQDQQQQQEAQQHSSPGPMSPPMSAHGAYYTPQHSRHASLDPATAAYMTGQSDWQAIMRSSAFQHYQRAPSEVSEVSSVAHSPYISQHESFDTSDANPSPLLAPQNDPGVYDNALGIESFTLSEQQGFSPAHSPYISPQLMPQQGADMVPNVPYLSTPQPPNPQYPTPPADIYGDGTGGMMNVTQASSSSGDIGQASQMAPPSINVEFAPPSRAPTFGPSKPAADSDSLSPPIANPRKLQFLQRAFYLLLLIWN